MVISIIFFVFLIELFLFFLFKKFRLIFKWLVQLEDEIPSFDHNALKKFHSSSYNSLLGWDRKANSSGYDKAKNSYIEFNIDSNGSRRSFHHNLPTKILTFGDSYTFCRQVKDEETWQNKLAEDLNCNILNFGVGNYGIDQAILKMENMDFPESADKAILCFVPETICRIQSYWKHYLEFGNIFAFKPRFKLLDNQLILIPNFINGLSDYEKIKGCINIIRDNDRFYHTKFKLRAFRFPYLYYFLKDLKLNFGLFYNLINFSLTKKNIYYDKAYSLIIKKNLQEAQFLYNDKDSTDLIFALFNKFISTCKSKRVSPVILIIPQLQDLLSTDCNHSAYFKNIKLDSKVIDMTDDFKLYDNVLDLYVDDIYGGHLSPLGNKFVARNLSKYL